MLYYRYRPASELSIKELLYDEIYFASTTECNDPYDGRPFYFFEADPDKWFRLLECAWSHVKGINYLEWAKSLAIILAGTSPLTFSQALNFDYRDALLKVQNPPDILFATGLSDLIKQYIDLYKPEESYFASFSKTCNNLLMWSHYASMYQGYCLIFRSISGELRQCPQHMKETINRKTEHGLAPSMGWNLPKSFIFEDISYNKNVSVGDAFLRFPQHVSGCSLDEDARIKLVSSQKRQYLEKHEIWDYEQESRILLMSPMPWLFGEHVHLTKQERLFHFQPSQLVGIVLGPHMKSEFKERIFEIARDKMNRLDIIASKTKTEIFDFVIFEAKLPDNLRDIIVEPVQILTPIGAKNKEDKDFAKMFTAWKDGWAIVFDGEGGGSKKQICN